MRDKHYVLLRPSCKRVAVDKTWNGSFDYGNFGFVTQDR